MGDMAKSFTLAVSALLLSAPATACARKDTVLDCHIEGIKYLGTDLNDGAVCARFVAGLGAAKARVASVHITVSKLGSITAQLFMMNGETKEMGMDVMDRPTRMSDLDQLAQAVAGQLQ
jgi:hypothetical protein